jgi:DNA-binding NarL/FixJ family response regulator
MWQILIVEDDPDMREFFEASVKRCAELELVAGVGSLAEARLCLDETRQIDVLLTDLGLPDGSGLEVIHHARLRHPECEALVISMFGDEDNVLASIEAGALGYIHKDAAPDDIAHTILEMKAGASPISPMIARRVLSNYLRLKSGTTPASAPEVQPTVPEAADGEAKSPLSRREQEVLGLIARGFSYAEIAQLNNVSVHTVKTHIKNIYGKLAVHSKNEAVFEATRMGLLPAQITSKPNQ